MGEKTVDTRGIIRFKSMNYAKKIFSTIFVYFYLIKESVKFDTLLTRLGKTKFMSI